MCPSVMLSPLCCSGAGYTFTTPMVIPSTPFSSAPMRIYEGIGGRHANLYNMCSSREELASRKQVFLFRPTTAVFYGFSTCDNTTTNFDTVLFLLQCNSQLASNDGSDVIQKGCTCWVNDDACGTGSTLLQTTSVGTWVYVVVAPKAAE